ncbi:MAG: hypothetical protein SVW02_00300 [Candidatus Nanohaloarchaea archaeon]|nr:hypothetical protein [Candidatus Nanohaloarchaea archaeon]
MDEVKRLVVVAALILGALLLGFAAGGDSGGAGGERRQYTVAALLEERPVEQPVVVEANVSRVADDYVSDSGNTYQQFFVSDGMASVKVFCGANSGRVNVSVGDTVRVTGTFQEYQGQYEIYTRCSSIQTAP